MKNYKTWAGYKMAQYKRHTNIYNVANKVAQGKNLTEAEHKVMKNFDNVYCTDEKMGRIYKDI